MLVTSLFSFATSSTAFFSRVTTNIGQAFLQRHRQQRRPTSSIAMVGIKLESSSAESNKEHIWNVLDDRVIKRILKNNSEGQQQPPPPLRVLEIAGGAGGTWMASLGLRSTFGDATTHFILSPHPALFVETRSIKNTLRMDID